VVHVEAGPPELPKEELPEVVDDFADGVLEHLRGADGVDLVHANYWLSGVAGHRIKHELDLPLVSTFHTLARVKAETGDPEPLRRVRAEAQVIGCSDAILASCSTEADELERHYGAMRHRIEIVPPGSTTPSSLPATAPAPGVRSATSSSATARSCSSSVASSRSRASTSPSPRWRSSTATTPPWWWSAARAGPTAWPRSTGSAASPPQLGVARRVRWVDPQPHHLLSTYYRAADVCLVPSRSESFGLVALEAAACGTPVVAAAVGGLRTLVEHGRTGFLVEGRDPAAFADHVGDLLADPVLASDLSAAAAARARGYTWAVAAARLRRVYADLTARQLVDCA
jgi:D-inositol-3-phosphate glycosyltransferase